MKLCIFCSANDHLSPSLYELTADVGRWAAARGHSIVFGGHDAGLMHTVSLAAHEAGATIIGVVPRKVEELGRLTPFLDVHIPTEDLTDRKQLMMDTSDAFIVLPGGIGTLDELFTVAAAATLGYHTKTVVLYNMDGFWDSLIAALDDLEQRGVMRRPWREQIQVAECLDDIDDILGL